ncbi:MAG: hypothetical protein WCK02_12285 [Bacteroidota bacterium]
MANSVFIVFGLMTHLEFLTLFGNFTIAGQENVSNSQTQQIRKTLCVSLKPTTEKNLCENEKIDKFEKNKNYMAYNLIDRYYTLKKLGKVRIKKKEFIFSQDEVLEIFKTSFNETIKNRSKEKTSENKNIRTLQRDL